MTTTSTAETPAGRKSASSVVLRVEGLDVDIRTPSGTVRAVSGVGFEARAGQTLALLGESGCGKSMTAKALAGVLDPVAHIAGGSAELEGRDLVRMSPKQRRKVAGAELGIVFQDALTVLNPVYPGGRPARRGLPHPPRALRQGRPQGGHRADEARGHPRTRIPRGRVPAPVLRRHAPAHPHRDGRGPEPQAADRRRAERR